MKLSIVDAGKFKLDGGAMFGVVPYSMWSKLNPPDEHSMCPWSMRSLLIETGDRKILIDCGIGDKQGEKFLSHFHPHDGDIFNGIEQLHDISYEDITDVLLTHLHFDHCGGSLRVGQDGSVVPTFPNATYWSCESHFDWAYTPNNREKASFLPENFVPLRDLGILKFIPEIQLIEWLPNINIRYSYGHTHAMMSPEIHLPNGKTVIFGADLMPSSLHVRMPYVMSYDIRPLKTLEEKAKFYKDIMSYDDAYVFFQHDPVHTLGKLQVNDRGRYSFDTNFTLSQI